jgi:Zn-dependent metalloprotease
VKKILGLLALVGSALVVFGIVSTRSEAQRTVFGSGSQDELEMAKQISLEVLRGRAANRSIGNVDEYEVKRVEIDELRMAHTRVQQKVNGIPVWEGEAIVHLKADGSLSDITDSLKEGIAVNTDPDLNERQAVRRGKAAYTGKAEQTDPEMVAMYIYRNAASRRHRTHFRSGCFHRCSHGRSGRWLRQSADRNRKFAL